MFNLRAIQQANSAGRVPTAPRSWSSNSPFVNAYDRRLTGDYRTETLSPLRSALICNPIC
jgi:hypothetical protein